MTLGPSLSLSGLSFGAVTGRGETKGLLESLLAGTLWDWEMGVGEHSWGVTQFQKGRSKGLSRGRPQPGAQGLCLGSVISSCHHLPLRGSGSGQEGGRRLWAQQQSPPQTRGRRVVGGERESEPTRSCDICMELSVRQMQSLNILTKSSPLRAFSAPV